MEGGFEEGQFGVDPAGLRDRYREIFSDPRVFVREVLQNALQAVRQAADDPAAHRIAVNIDRAGRYVDFLDDGVGMEPEQARLAVSRFFRSAWADGSAPAVGAEEEDDTFEAIGRMLRRLHDDDVERPLDALDGHNMAPSDIGRFGMGLTTCLMVADSYVMTTCPPGGTASEHRVEVAWGSGSPLIKAYHRTVKETLDDSFTTRVRVPIGIKGPSGEIRRDPACLDETAMRNQIQRYMALTEVPIFVNGTPVIGLDPRREAVPDLFFDHADSAGDDPVRFELVRRGEGYVRALITLSGSSHSPAQMQVYSRGVLVGALPTSEVLGDDLAMFGGSIDSDMYDLQVDRNRLQKDARLDDFRDRMGVWICEGLAEGSKSNWEDYVSAFPAHRLQLLHYLYQYKKATLALGPQVPFQDALQPDRHRPLVWYLSHAYAVAGGRTVLPFASEFCVDHPALSIWADFGVAVAQFGQYAPTRHGRVNLDLMFVRDHVAMTDQKVLPSRIDVLLREISKRPAGAADGRNDKILNALRSRYSKLCEVDWTALGTYDIAALVATPMAQMLEDEAPGLESASNNPLLKMLRELASEDPTFKDLLGEFDEHSASMQRPFVLLNLKHPLVKSIRQRRGAFRRPPVPIAKAVEVADVLVATALLSSTTLPRSDLRERVATAVARLVKE